MIARLLVCRCPNHHPLNPKKLIIDDQGDPQTAFSYLGDVVLFVQYTLAKYKVGVPNILLWILICLV